MFTIGVLSDTHLKTPTDDFKRFLTKTFGSADMIVHAGDMTSVYVYEFLSNFNVKAVKGNMDDSDLKSILPDKITFEVMGLRFGIIHGQGPPFGIEDLVLKEFENVDVIIFGHSHVPTLSKRGKVYLFNPGSYRKPFTPPPTVGILRIDEGKITFDHVVVTGP